LKKTKADRRWKKEGGYIDNDEPNRVKKFVETFGRMPDKPNEKISFFPWVFDEIVTPLYGHKKANGDTNRFSFANIFCMKKQSKSSTVAMLALYDLCCNPGRNVVIWSENIQSSSEIWRYASYMADTTLSKYLKVNHNLKTITYKKNASQLLMLSGSPKGKRGGLLASVYIDELSEVRDNLISNFEALEQSRIGSPGNWKMVTISTPNYDRNSICWQAWTKAKSIINNEDDDTSTLAVIKAVPDEFADSPKEWWKFIPSLGITTSKDDYLSMYEKAKSEGPRKLGVFRCEQLCQWIASADQWIPDSIIKAASINIDEKELYGKDAWIGVDAAVIHLGAYVVLVEHDDSLIVIPRFSLAEKEALKSDKKYGGSWMAWGKAGYIDITDGDKWDEDHCGRQLIEDFNRFNVVSACSDGFNFTSQAAKLEEKHGITINDLMPKPRVIAEATVEFERRICKGQLKFIENPCYAFNLRCCQIKTWQDGIFIDRSKSAIGGKRYDGISATIHALNRYINQPAYSYSGLFSLDA